MTRANATYSTLLRRAKYGGRKGRRARLRAVALVLEMWLNRGKDVPWHGVTSDYARVT